MLINVKRGHEVELEYSRKDILEKLNNLFGYSVVEQIKQKSFDDEKIFRDRSSGFVVVQCFVC